MDIEQNLQTLGKDALQDLYNNLVAAKAFAVEQAPDVCQQIIAWEITKGCITAAVMLLAGIATAYGIKYVWRSVEDQADRVPAGFIITVVAIAYLCILGATTTCGPIGTGLKAYIAPKVVLLEYVANALK